uniref:Uncharacterized protein n=1 Tax=Palpitomonas bilix TaxID=652834 RepID=A0A7S3CXH0_9EUKA|mmetsp:Transcript_10913/g.28625  ORF Transcript_10913/g.28625 Transcript_10913/m.28625 type:complete len:119 (+) Transcript_10913:998-1354(+)
MWIKRLLVSASGETLSDETVKCIHPGLFLSAAALGREEFSNLSDLNDVATTLRQHSTAGHILYPPVDRWAPDWVQQEVLEAVPNIEAVMSSPEFKHAFCLFAPQCAEAAAFVQERLPL